MNMPTPRLISPILDGFRLEDPISRHGATQCYNAVEDSSGDNYIVKMISIPGSARELDALLMAGAFSSRTQANNYYKDQARRILNEAKTLRHMAALGGFVDYDSIQVAPAPHENGVEVYMLSPYRTSFHRIMSQGNPTQLEVVNLGLDLCAALSVCRHAGFLYANLKPENIFRIGSNYRIGDLGFLPLSAVDHSVLPEHLQSKYSAPELLSGSTLLNDTADIYSLGLILYQAYNDGVLPEEKDIVGKLYAPPKYADYELAEIILRACALDPAIRWHDPMQMSHALARYLHRNGTRNVPIVPAVFVEPELPSSSIVEEFLPEEEDMVSPEGDGRSAADSGSAEPTKNGKTGRWFRIALIAAAALALLLLTELLVAGWILWTS